MAVKKIIIYISICMVIVTILYFLARQIVFNTINDYYSLYIISHSINEAINNKVFRKRVEIVPNQITIDGELIKFKECWIEEKTQESHILIFFKTRKYLGTYNLCLTFEYPTKPFAETDYFFVKDDLGSGFAFRGITKDKLNILSDEISINGPTSFKVSIIKSWQDKRQKNLTFWIK